MEDVEENKVIKQMLAEVIKGVNNILALGNETRKESGGPKRRVGEDY